MALSKSWPDENAPPRESSPADWVFKEHAEHLALVNPQGETWQVANVLEDPDDPSRLKIAGRWFRAEGA